MKKKGLFDLKEKDAKNYGWFVKLIFWTGFAFWVLPMMVTLIFAFGGIILVQLFYIIRYPLDLYLSKLLTGKKPKLKWILID